MKNEEEIADAMEEWERAKGFNSLQEKTKKVLAFLTELTPNTTRAERMCIAYLVLNTIEAEALGYVHSKNI